MAASLLDLLKGNARIQSAAKNNPPMRKGESNTAAVNLLQQAYVAIGYSMPGSTMSSGEMDGIFGTETDTITRTFQTKMKLVADGVLGTNTFLALFDEVAKVVVKVVEGATTALDHPILSVGLRELELGIVNWKNNPVRVKDYFRASVQLKPQLVKGKRHHPPKFEDWLQEEQKTHHTSWCTFFAHFCLLEAGLDKGLPKTSLGPQSVSRFAATFIPGGNTKQYSPAKYVPVPGDLYYMPQSPLAKGRTDHIGLVLAVENPRQLKTTIWSLDGNSITPATQSQWLPGSGGGMVCMNRREAGLIEYYIPQPRP